MSTSPAPHSRRATDAARAACDVIEMLEILWERGRDTASAVSASQLRVLYSLERADGINLRTLGDVLGSAPSSVSRLCDRLEAMGLVERTPSPVSRRELTIRLTGHGRAYLSELRSQREEVLLAAIEAMDPASRAALLEGLHGFRDAVVADGDRSPGPDGAGSARQDGGSAGHA
ncbi:MarR family winged helix-turn-helix transcriptional regulator [Streptomyces marianii]|uniref:Winged helix-turn-helix transcriptional regulator n=1 Tax=Streptomyces marianii TaxID=1817406 RepID=A0A5R9E0P1_9ACTN|nr:MarR family winged helix-turn-helix transcriptional regulator [Streptomyces marianii]TLQ42977.1 winged helix-turn-helix transcriptional regulator [Streptomyces marianii]